MRAGALSDQRTEQIAKDNAQVLMEAIKLNEEIVKKTHELQTLQASITTTEKLIALDDTTITKIKRAINQADD